MSGISPHGEAAVVERELDDVRAELDAIGLEVAAAEAGLAELARRDVQVRDLRLTLEKTRRRMQRLSDRERSVREGLRASAGAPGRLQ